MHKQTNPLKTLFVIVIGLIVFYIKFRLNWILYTALLISVGGVISKKICASIEFIWMKLAWVLSLIIPNILLSIIFYLILFPIASLSKILGASNGIILKNNQQSFFKKVDKKFEKSSFEKPW